MSLLPSIPRDYFQETQSWLGVRFDCINRSRSAAQAKIESLESALAVQRLIPDDASFVVFGSLARKEWTAGSDLDWSLLIDGAVDPAHVKVVQKIGEALKEIGFPSPGREAVFGGLSFSHELVHHIGGHDDTNRNLTRRVLLLLESRVVGSEQAYERVVKAVLERYCEEDAHIYSPKEQRFKVPRFLVNDVVRFWRTIAVDYVSKRRERGNKGWALRNAKLRLSRKLLFVSGMLMCLQCRLKPIPGEEAVSISSDLATEPLMTFLTTFVERTPLDIVCELLIKHGAAETAVNILRPYDGFLGILDDKEKRKNLSELPYEVAESSPLFEDIRSLGRTFQAGLEQFFFRDNAELSQLTNEYGMF